MIARGGSPEMPHTELRSVRTENVVYIALPDMAALLLDAAVTLDGTPEITAGAALRALSLGLAKYEPTP